MNFFKKIFTGASKLQAKSYEGATTGRRLGFWGLNSAGPNTAIGDSLSHLRSRSRELARNNPWVANGFRSLASNLIGCGITPRWRLEDVELKQQIQEQWLAWTNDADFDGQTDFYGLQMLVAQTLMQSGEALVRVVPQKIQDSISIPISLQVLEPDFLVDDFDRTLDNGNKLQLGIEFSKRGKKVAYHLHNSHPGEGECLVGKTLRYPVKDILHIYRLERPGQIRGVPWLSSILLKLKDLDEYEDAELVRKKNTTMLAGFVTNSNEPGFGSNNEPDPDREVKLESGMMQILQPGENIEFTQTPDVGSNYEPWMKQQLRAIAVGLGVTYEQLTGDLRGVNYSSIRAGLIEFRRQVECLQHHLIVQQLCQPIAIRWLDMAVLSGALKIPDYFDNPTKYQRIDWQPPGWDWVDPLKDIQAEILAMDNHLKARQDIIAKYGMDAEEVDKNIAQDKLRHKSLYTHMDMKNESDE